MTLHCYMLFDLDFPFLDRSYAKVLPSGTYFDTYDKNDCPRSISVRRRSILQPIDEVFELRDEAIMAIIEEGNRRDREYWKSLSEMI